MSYKWYWMNDSGWTVYDAKKSAELEKGFTNKSKSVTLDKERFVDLSLSWAEICKNFTNLTEKTMVGIQRRFDDHNKRRAVKREKDTSTDFFDGLEFAFLSQVQGNKMKVKETEFVTKVKTYGGKVVSSITKTVDYVVVTTATLDDPSAETALAESLKIPIVFSSFITKCILEGALADNKSFIVPIPKKKKVDSDEEEEGTKKSKKTSKKKKDEEGEGEGEGEEEEKPKKGKKKAKKEESEEEEEEEKPKKVSKKKGKKADSEEEEEEKPKSKKDSKKRKADSDEEEDEEEPKVKKSKVDTTDKKSSTTTTTTPSASSGSSINGLTILQPGSEWEGTYSDPTDGSNSSFPFRLQVLKIESSSFEGFVFWKTMNDAQTKIRGKFAPNGNGGDLDVDFEEYEAVKGEDELELPNSYSGVLSGKKMTGRVGDAKSKSTFSAELSKPGLAKLPVPHTWNGSCKSDTPFVINVASRDDDELTGTIEWQVTPLTITKWRGKVSGLKLVLEEYEVEKGDDEFLLRTWHLNVTQDETLSVSTPDNETFTVNLKN